MMKFYFLILAFISTCLLGCAHTQSYLPAETMVAKAGLKLAEFQTNGFVITTYLKILKADAPVHVYIEGDGHAWITRSQPSADPTPFNPLVLQLASMRNEQNIVYLARPCQYSLSRSPQCNERFWTDLRFSKQAVLALDDVLNQIKANHSEMRFELNGYSGGGAMAVLLAAYRKDVTAIRTIAGNLDHHSLNVYHQVSQMPESLNPIDYVAQVKRIPQLHFVGGKDTIVPPEIVRNFVNKVGECARIEVVQNASHEDGWLENWEEISSMPLKCKGLN